MTTIGQSVIMNLDAGRLQDLLRKGKLQANSLADIVHLFSIKGVRRIDKAIITYRGDGKDRGEPWDAPMIVNVVYTVLASLKDEVEWKMTYVDGRKRKQVLATATKSTRAGPDSMFPYQETVTLLGSSPVWSKSTASQLSFNGFVYSRVGSILIVGKYRGETFVSQSFPLLVKPQNPEKKSQLRIKSAADIEFRIVSSYSVDGLGAVTKKRVSTKYRAISWDIAGESDASKQRACERSDSESEDDDPSGDLDDTLSMSSYGSPGSRPDTPDRSKLDGVIDVKEPVDIKASKFEALQEFLDDQELQCASATPSKEPSTYDREQDGEAPISCAAPPPEEFQLQPSRSPARPSSNDPAYAALPISESSASAIDVVTSKPVPAAASAKVECIRRISVTESSPPGACFDQNIGLVLSFAYLRPLQSDVYFVVYYLDAKAGPKSRSKMGIARVSSEFLATRTPPVTVEFSFEVEAPEWKSMAFASTPIYEEIQVGNIRLEGYYKGKRFCMVTYSLHVTPTSGRAGTVIDNPKFLSRRINFMSSNGKKVKEVKYDEHGWDDVNPVEANEAEADHPELGLQHVGKDEAAPVQVEAHVTRALEGAPSGHETTRTKPMSAGPPSSKAGSDVHDRAPAPSSEQAPGAVVAGHVTTQTESAGPLISRAGMAVDDRAPALSSEQASGAAVVGNSEAPPRRGPHLLRLSIDEASVKIDERWTLRRNDGSLAFSFKLGKGVLTHELSEHLVELFAFPLLLAEMQKSVIRLLEKGADLGNVTAELDAASVKVEWVTVGCMKLRCSARGIAREALGRILQKVKELVRAESPGGDLEIYIPSVEEAERLAFGGDPSLSTRYSIEMQDMRKPKYKEKNAKSGPYFLLPVGSDGNVKCTDPDVSQSQSDEHVSVIKAEIRTAALQLGTTTELEAALSESVTNNLLLDNCDPRLTESALIEHRILFLPCDHKRESLDQGWLLVDPRKGNMYMPSWAGPLCRTEVTSNNVAEIRARILAEVERASALNPGCDYVALRIERPASVVLQSWINRALARVKDLRKENAQLKKELNDTIAKELKKRASASTPQISATHAKEFLEKDFRCGYLYKEHEESAELLEPFVPNPEIASMCVLYRPKLDKGWRSYVTKEWTPTAAQPDFATATIPLRTVLPHAVRHDSCEFQSVLLVTLKASTGRDKLEKAGKDVPIRQVRFEPAMALLAHVDSEVPVRLLFGVGPQAKTVFLFTYGEFSKRAKDEEEFRKSYEDGDGRKQGDDRVEFVPHALQRIGFVSMRQVFKEISNATSESPKPRVYFTDEGAYVDVTKFQSLDRDVGSAAAPDIPTSLQSYRKLGFSDDTIRAVGSDPESSPAVLCTIYNCYQKKETYAHVTFNSLAAGDNDAVERRQRLLGICDQIKNPDKYSGGVLGSKPRGLIMYGPPGSGKTLTAKAIANECGCPFLNFEMKDVSNLWMGNSEKLVGGSFGFALDLSREFKAITIIYIDEAETMLGNRATNTGPNAADANSRVTMFLQKIDGFATGGTDGRIGYYVIISTNHPEMIDPAIKSRLTESLEVGRPGPADLGDVLAGDVKKVNASSLDAKGNQLKYKYAADVDTSAIAEFGKKAHRNNFSYREVTKALHDAAKSALHKNYNLDHVTFHPDGLRRTTGDQSDHRAPVLKQHLMKALDGIAPVPRSEHDTSVDGVDEAKGKGMLERCEDLHKVEISKNLAERKRLVNFEMTHQMVADFAIETRRHNVAVEGSIQQGLSTFATKVAAEIGSSLGQQMSAVGLRMDAIMERVTSAIVALVSAGVTGVSLQPVPPAALATLPAQPDRRPPAPGASDPSDPALHPESGSVIRDPSRSGSPRRPSTSRGYVAPDPTAVPQSMQLPGTPVTLYHAYGAGVQTPAGSPGEQGIRPDGAAGAMDIPGTATKRRLSGASDAENAGRPAKAARVDSTIGESSGNNRSHANAMGQEDSAARGTGGNNRNDVDAMSVKTDQSMGVAVIAGLGEDDGDDTDMPGTFETLQDGLFILRRGDRLYDRKVISTRPSNGIVFYDDGHPDLRLTGENAPNESKGWTGMFCSLVLDHVMLEIEDPLRPIDIEFIYEPLVEGALKAFLTAKGIHDAEERQRWARRCGLREFDNGTVDAPIFYLQKNRILGGKLREYSLWVPRDILPHFT